MTTTNTPDPADSHQASEYELDKVLNALEAIVIHAAPDGTQDDGDFVGFYVLSTGELHKAIPVLQNHNRFATPLGDPQLKSRYQALIAAKVAEAEIAAQMDILRGFRRRDFVHASMYEAAVLDRLAELQQQLNNGKEA